MLSCTGVQQNRTNDVSTAEQTNGPRLPGANPPGLSLLVNLQVCGTEHIGGIMEPKETVQVPVEIF